MNKYTISILITTFLRDTLLNNTIQNIIENYSDDYIVLIADQGYNDDEKNINMDYFKSQINLEYHRIPFDSGLSYARNYLISRAKELNIPYILMSADSIQFNEVYNFSPYIDVLEANPKLGAIGFNLKNSKCPWEFNMEILPSGIKLSTSKEIITVNNLVFKKVDICRNIFLAKTNTMLNLYDEEMKLAEHELAFLEYKKRGYQVYWTDSLSFKRVTTNAPEEYQEYRKRFNDYKKLLQSKLSISGWVTYSPEAMKEIKSYKERTK